jgi:hypothetical protein
MKKILNIKISLIIMIALPLLSILIGFYGMKWYLLSNNKYEDDVNIVEDIIQIKTEPIEKVELQLKTISLKEISFFAIQMGAFTREENAIEFMDSLNDKDNYSFYIKNNNYIVYSFFSENKELLNENLELCRNEISDAFIKRITLKSDEFTYYIKDKDYLIDIVNDINKHFINTMSNNVITDDEYNRLIDIKANLDNLISFNKENELIVNNITSYLDGLISRSDLLISNDDDELKKYVYENIRLYLKYLINS